MALESLLCWANPWDHRAVLPIVCPRLGHLPMREATGVSISGRDGLSTCAQEEGKGQMPSVEDRSVNQLEGKTQVRILHLTREPGQGLLYSQKIEQEVDLEGLSPREQESLKFLLDTIAALDGDEDRDPEALDSGQDSVPDGSMEHKPLSTIPQPLTTPSRLRKFDTIVRSGISVRELRDHFRGLNQVPGTTDTTGEMLPPRAQKPGLLPGHVKLARTPSQVVRVPKL